MSAFTKAVSGHKSWGAGRDKARASLASMLEQQVKERTPPLNLPARKDQQGQSHNLHFPVEISWEYDTRYRLCLRLVSAWLEAGRPLNVSSSTELSKLTSQLTKHDYEYLINWLQRTSTDFIDLILLVGTLTGVGAPDTTKRSGTPTRTRGNVMKSASAFSWRSPAQSAQSGVSSITGSTTSVSTIHAPIAEPAAEKSAPEKSAPAKPAPEKRERQEKHGKLKNLEKAEKPEKLEKPEKPERGVTRMRTFSGSTRARLGTMSTAIRHSREKLSSTCSLNINEPSKAAGLASLDLDSPGTRRRANTMTSCRSPKTSMGETVRRSIRLRAGKLSQLNSSVGDLTSLHSPGNQRRMTASTSNLVPYEIRDDYHGNSKKIVPRSEPCAVSSLARTGLICNSKSEEEPATDAATAVSVNKKTGKRPLAQLPRAKQSDSTSFDSGVDVATPADPRDRQLPSIPHAAGSSISDAPSGTVGTPKAIRSRSVPIVIISNPLPKEKRHLRKAQSIGESKRLSNMSRSNVFKFHRRATQNGFGALADIDMEPGYEITNMPKAELHKKFSKEKNSSDADLEEEQVLSSGESPTPLMDDGSLSENCTPVASTLPTNLLANQEDSHSGCSQDDTVVSASLEKEVKKGNLEPDFDMLQSLFLSKSDCRLNKTGEPQSVKARAKFFGDKSKHKTGQPSQVSSPGNTHSPGGVATSESPSKVSGLSSFKMSFANFGARQRRSSNKDSAVNQFVRRLEKQG